MTDQQLILLLALLLPPLVSIGISVIRKRFSDPKVEVLYGYPANSKTWLTIYHYRKSDRWLFEWDHVFAEERPSCFGDISKCMMFENKDSGATQQEFSKAWELLHKRSLCPFK